jgi:aryl-alcohol dehydrogenase-like predicted oxidoreductase
MHYRQLGKSELNVSEIALGSWLTFGVGVERERTASCFRKAFELGINFFDTANIYGKGAAESMLGEVLAPFKRSSYILSTKLFFAMSETDRGLSAAQIRKQLDASLQRLRTDYIDLYQCHRYDDQTPLEETMTAMSAAVRSGKVRYIGFSEWNAAQILAARKIPGSAPFISSQPQYSMLWRKPEAEIIPLCAELGINQIVWSPLAQGVLSGKYKPGTPPPPDSRAANPEMNVHFSDQGQDLRDEKLLAAVQQLRPLAEAMGVTMTQLALAWVLRNRNVAAAIVGCSRPEQLVENAGASGVKISDDVAVQIDRLLANFAKK